MNEKIYQIFHCFAKFVRGLKLHFRLRDKFSFQISSFLELTASVTLKIQLEHADVTYQMWYISSMHAWSFDARVLFDTSYYSRASTRLSPTSIHHRCSHVNESFSNAALSFHQFQIHLVDSMCILYTKCKKETR